MQEYTAEFETLLNRLPSYDESWMLKIFIWGLQPHMAKSVSAHRPKTVDEAIILAEEIDFSIRTSQQDRLTGKPIHTQKQNQGQNRKLRGTKMQHKFEDNG